MSDIAKRMHQIDLADIAERQTERALLITWRRRADTLRIQRDAALEQARRDREYTAAQTGTDVQLVNQVLALVAERDALALTISILTNERDEARARGSLQP